MLVLGHLERFSYISKDPIEFEDLTKGRVLEIASSPETGEILWKIEMDDIQFAQFNFSFPNVTIIKIPSEYCHYQQTTHDLKDIYSLLSKNEKEKINYLIYFSGGKVSEREDYN